MTIQAVSRKVQEFLMRRSRMLEIVFFISIGAALLITRIAEYTVSSASDPEHWATVQSEICSYSLAAAAEEFTTLQRFVRRTATDFGSYPSVVTFLTGKVADPAELFALAARVGLEQGVGIEVYDRDGRLVAWYGRSGAAQQRVIRIALDGQMTSFVGRSSAFSQLFVATPVRDHGTIIGAILVQQTIEVDYPLNNAYINREGLSDRISRKLGIQCEINFSPTAEPRQDGRYASAVLYGIDSSSVGIINILKPGRAAYLDVQSARFQTMNAALFGILLLGFAAAAGQRLNAVRQVPLRLAASLVLVWLTRALLLWLDFPSVLFATGIFDPGLFASGFSGGLAKSIGDLTITCLALVVSVILVGKRMWDAGLSVESPGTRRRQVLGIVGALVMVSLSYMLLRGLAAAVRSIVFDSSLRLTDTRTIFPTIPESVLLLDVFALSWCLIALVCCGWFVALRFIVGSQSPSLQARFWVLAAVSCVACAFIVQLLPGDPLVTVWYRAMFGVGALAYSFFVFRSPERHRSPFRPRRVVLAFGFSAFLVYVLMAPFVNEKDHQRIEGFAREVLRPVDSWFNNVIHEALAGFATPETADVLAGGEQDSVARLAFTHWAMSIACREGYTSVFSVVDNRGVEVSRFSIGGESVRAADIDTLVQLPQQGSLQVRTLGTGINAVKVYSGSIPIVSAQGVLLGYGRVLIAAGQQTLFRGDNPAILRGSSGEVLENYYRPVWLSEFRDGILLTSSNPRVPIGIPLPEAVRSTFENRLGASLWVDETIDDVEYETYYVTRDEKPADVIALSLQAQGFVWNFINGVKMALFFAILSVTFLAIMLGVRIWKGERRTATFRDRLLIALIVIALLPLILIAIYGRYNAQQRLVAETQRRLEEETSTLVSYLLDQISTNAGGIRTSFTPALADQIASDLGIDFNLYIGDGLRLTSRPELYEAGILDRRLSGPAYSNILVKGRRFFTETESIGGYQYAVGYSPLQDASGSILGVVSVPTLYRQDQIEEETARRNAFLIAAYAVILLAIIALATALANRFAAPIHSLTQATRRVSGGDLDVKVNAARADGEVGDLIRAFEAMTQDLKRSREVLVRFEREAAWKEMAKQVAHEIKNPLTPMKLAVQHLRQTYRDRVQNFDEILDDVTATLVAQIDALSRIASEFSHFARMPKRQLELIDVNKIVNESVSLFEQDTDHEIRLNLEAGLPPVLVDPEELRRAFINILRNGFQAMEESGTMEVRSWGITDGVRIGFRDSGPGIPEEIRARLFEPNFSTKTDGMGLGLSIVKKTIDELGGTITIESAIGKGTLVSIDLPAAESAGGGV